MSVCLSVCLSVFQTITFDSLDVRSSFFAHPVDLQGIWVKFVYEGHQVNVMVGCMSKKCDHMLK